MQPLAYWPIPADFVAGGPDVQIHNTFYHSRGITMHIEQMLQTQCISITVLTTIKTTANSIT